MLRRASRISSSPSFETPWESTRFRPFRERRRTDRDTSGYTDEVHHPAETVPLPASYGVRLDPATLQDGCVLMGGTPFRIVRLSRDHATALARWQSGEPIGTDAGAGRFARALVASNLAQPVPPAEIAPASVSVIVPVRDRHGELDALLCALRASETTDPVREIIVVDDASTDVQAHARVAARWDARLLRRGVRGGSAATRNDGASAASGDLLAFVDSDCIPRPGWLAALLPHFVDPAVAAVAPRIVAHDRSGAWLSRYEAARSGMDRGPLPARVVPGGRVPFVPTAALVARVRHYGEGFDPTLRGGEDLDFVWRLTSAGLHIRYEPAGAVEHRHRTSLPSFLRRRAYYGRTAAPLARRHPGAARPLAVSPWTAVAWGALGLRAPILAAATTALAAGLLARQLRSVVDEPVRNAVRLAAGGTLRSGEAVADACVRAWWPLSVTAFAAIPRLRPALAAAVLLPALLEWRREPSALDPVRWLVARRLDDAAYAWGLWQGCVTEGVWDPVRPDLGWRLRTLTSDEFVDCYRPAPPDQALASAHGANISPSAGATCR